MSVIGKKALLLGAGFVCEPAVKALAEAGVHVTVGSRTLSTAQQLVGSQKNATAIALDVANDAVGLSDAVSKTDIVISLVPYVLHPVVVEAAITHKKPVVTTSYISPALWDLDEKAKPAGVTILNEIGMDPGVDHLYAVKTIDEVHKAGGKIVGFTSNCGALPAPKSANNPLGYKFSWSPRGGLLALLNNGRWYENGEIATVEGKNLMAIAKPLDIPGFDLVGYPNRDSAGFREFYQIPEAKTVFRGTMRYTGFPEVIRSLIAIGYFSLDERSSLKSTHTTLGELTAELLGLSSASSEDLKKTVAQKIKSIVQTEDESARVISSLDWIGIFDSNTAVEARTTPLDTLGGVLEKKMSYQPGEQDMVLLQHIFDIVHADGTKEKRSSTLLEYGEPVALGSRSAMAKLVGLPCASGVIAVLEGRIKQTGMVAPWTTAEIATLLREDIYEKHGITMEEKVIG